MRKIRSEATLGRRPAPAVIASVTVGQRGMLELDAPSMDAGVWNDIHPLQPPRSIQRPYRIGDHPGRREISALSEAESSVTPLPRIHGRNGHGIMGGRPSNRSEAAHLARELAQQLDAAGGTFRAELDAYNKVFGKVSQQVAVHCAERGDVLERLRIFYTRSHDVTARVVEATVRNEMQSRIEELEAQVKDLEAEVEELAKRQMQPNREEQILELFRSLPQRKQQRTLGLLFSDFGRLLTRVGGSDRLQSDDEQAATLNHLLRTLDAPDKARVLVRLIAINPMKEQLPIVKRLLGTLPIGEQLKTSLDILVPEQQRRILLAIFDTAQNEAEKASLLLDVLNTLPAPKLTSCLANILSALRSEELLQALSATITSMATASATAFTTKIIQLLNAQSGAKAISDWASYTISSTQLAATLELEKPHQEEPGFNFTNPGAVHGHSTEALLSASKNATRDRETLHNLAVELLRLLGYEQAMQALNPSLSSPQTGNSGT